jgi:lysine 2,3-aminomutase
MMLDQKKFKEKDSWQTQYRNSLKSYQEIESFFNLPTSNLKKFTSLLPQHFAEKIKQAGPNSPLWKQFIHSEDELTDSGVTDPIGDKKHAKGNGIIHRYESRILFTPTTNCPIICRYCFRKNELSSNDDIFKQNLDALAQYLSAHQEVNEVILTGGDPLILSNKKLERIFSLLSSLNIKFLRLHTRTPIILPNRIDDGFIDLLKKFERSFTKIIFVLHTNHEDELDSEVCLSLNKLRETKVDKKTQSVLLKGINNTAEDLLKLFNKLLDCDFTPYYLHHPDNVYGAKHFCLSLEEGRHIYIKLRQKMPGWAIPHYVIDHPEGHGKQLAFNPENIEFSGKMLNSETVLISYNT